MARPYPPTSAARPTPSPTWALQAAARKGTGPGERDPRARLQKAGGGPRAGFPLGLRDRRRERGKPLGFGVFFTSQDRNLGHPEFGRQVLKGGDSISWSAGVLPRGDSSTAGRAKPPLSSCIARPALTRPEGEGAHPGLRPCWPGAASAREARPAGRHRVLLASPPGPRPARTCQRARGLYVTCSPEHQQPPTRPLALRQGRKAGGDSVGSGFPFHSR